MTQYKKANDEIRDIAAKLASFQSQPIQSLHEPTIHQYLNTLQSYSAGMSKLEQKASEKDPNKQIYNSTMVANILALKGVFDQTLQECTVLYEKVKVMEQEKAQMRAREEEKSREEVRLKTEANDRERAKLAEDARLKALSDEQERIKAQEAEKARKIAAEEAEKLEKETQQAAAKTATQTTIPTATSPQPTESAVRMHITDTPSTLEEAAQAIDALKDRKAPQDEVKAAVQTYLAIKERTVASTPSTTSTTSQSQSQTSSHTNEAGEETRRQEVEKRKAEDARKTAEAAEQKAAEDAKKAEEAAKKAREDAQKVEAQRAATQQRQQEESKTKDDVQTQGQKRKLDSAASLPELAGLELEEGLRTLASNSSRDEYGVIVSSLLGYVSNIVAAPMDSRFYKVKAHPLLERTGGTESLHAIGFRSTDDSDQFEMVPSAAGWPVLLNAKKTLERAKAKPQEERKLPTLTPAQPASQTTNQPQAPSQPQPPNLGTLLQGLLNPPGAGGQRPVNPLGSVLQNPAIQQLMSNPQAIQQALHQVLGGLGGLAPPTPTTSAPVSAPQSTSTQSTIIPSTTTASTTASTTPSTTVPSTTAPTAPSATVPATSPTTTSTTTTAHSAADDLALSDEEMIAEAIRMSMEEEHSK